MRTGNISFLLWFLREFIVCHLSLFWMLFTSSLQIAHILSHSFIFDKSAFRDVFLEEEYYNTETKRGNRYADKYNFARKAY